MAEDTTVVTAVQQAQGEIHRLRLDLAQAREDRRAAELSERRLWLACGYLMQAHAFADGEQWETARVAAKKADDLLGGLVPLTPARG